MAEAPPPHDQVDEIYDISQHFPNYDLKKNLNKIPPNEYIALVRSKAEEFESKIAEAAPKSLEFINFLVIAHFLNQYIGFLDKVDMRDSEEFMTQKIEVIKYIRGIQDLLDTKRKLDN